MKKAWYRDFEGLKLQTRSEGLEVKDEPINVSEQWDALGVRKKCKHASRNHISSISSYYSSAINISRRNNNVFV